VAKICKKAILTDYEEKTLQFLQNNIDLNNFSVSNKPTCCQLSWGDTESINSFQSKYGEFVNLIIGSDLIYQSRSIDPLFFTVSCLLSSAPAAAFVLSFCDRNNHLPHVLSAAHKYNFEHEPVDLTTFLKYPTSMARIMIFRKLKS